MMFANAEKNGESASSVERDVAHDGDVNNIHNSQTWGGASIRSI